ncbi:MAG: L-histidine N(alpha)-methyltransferase [Phycisphaeraceae bacterium]
MNLAGRELELTDRGLSAHRVRQLLMQGLTAKPKTLPCALFYDKVGSRLFEQICELDEYYPTRTEIGIYRRYMGRITDRLGPRCAVIEYGSGAGVKSRMLLDALDEPVAYVPIEISPQALIESCAELVMAYPQLEVLPVCADYTQPLDLPRPRESPDRWAIFFPGSTIGNFHPAQAAAFLRRSAQLVDHQGVMVIGVDVPKDPAVLEAAYNDRQGVTAAFNLNLLRRANHQAGADFDLSAFRHRAVYNADHHRIEMHLISRRAQTVHMGGRTIHFAPGESILTECSYKYSPAQFASVAQRADWRPREVWTDDRGWFSVHLLEK